MRNSSSTTPERGKERFIFEYFFYNKKDEFVKSKKFTCATEKEAEAMANNISNNWLRVNHYLETSNQQHK